MLVAEFEWDENNEREVSRHVWRPVAAWPSTQAEREQARSMKDSEIEQLQDPENWEQDGELLAPRLVASAVVAVRFPQSELDAIRRMAAGAGVSTAELIRRAATAALLGVPDGPHVIAR